MLQLRFTDVECFVNLINTVQRFQCWSFYSSLICQAAEIMRTLACDVKKYIACQSLHGWRCRMQSKKKQNEVLPVKYRYRSVLPWESSFWPVSLDNLDKINMTTSLYVKEKVYHLWVVSLKIVMNYFVF